MKKFLVPLYAMLFVFGAAANVQAYPINPITAGIFDSYDTGSVYIGGTLDLNASAWSSSNNGQDWLENVNKVISLYNGYDLLDATSPFVEVDNPWDGGATAGTIDLLPGYEYLTMKWNGYFGTWYIAGLSEFSFSGLNHDLSHYRLWDAQPIPEPSTMLLLGFGLVGLAVVGRKKFQ